MISSDKKRVILQGKILSLQVGECAIIASSQGVIRTSTVAVIECPAADYTVFETRNSIYCILPVREPASMFAPSYNHLCAVAA